MKNKLAVTFVCILIIAYFVPAVHAIDENNSYTGVPIDYDSLIQNNIGYKTTNAKWSEQAKLIASDGEVINFFGLSVSMDGDYVVIGAHGDRDNGNFSGSAYIFKRDGPDWIEDVKLLASDGRTNMMFGYSVSIDGDYIIIGAPDADGPGSAYIFKNNGLTWIEQQKLTASDGEIWDEFGTSVSIDGDYAVVGAQFDDDIGSAYIFKREGETWNEEAKLTSSDSELEDCFGISASLYGEYAIIGGWGDDKYTGSAYVFKRTGTTWTEEAKLTASDGIPGDRFGVSVSTNGEYAIVGTVNNEDWTGAAYVFKRSGSNWIEEQKLTASDGEPGDCFGISVPIDGDCIIVGAYDDDDSGAHSGSAYVFKHNGNTWVEKQKLISSDIAAYDQFGCCIAIDGDCAIIGAYSEDDFTGSAYIFSASTLSFEIKGGVGVRLVINNSGLDDAAGVEWVIKVEGGLLGFINKTENGSTDIIAGDKKIVSTGLFFGFGSIDITASIDGEKKTAKGIQIFMLTII